MQSIHAYYDGIKFIFDKNTDIQPKQKVIITILDDFITGQQTESRPFEKYCGKLDDDSRNEIESALKDCERIDADEWLFD